MLVLSYNKFKNRSKNLCSVNINQGSKRTFYTWHWWRYKKICHNLTKINEGENRSRILKILMLVIAEIGYLLGTAQPAYCTGPDESNLYDEIITQEERDKFNGLDISKYIQKPKAQLRDELATSCVLDTNYKGINIDNLAKDDSEIGRSVFSIQRRLEDRIAYLEDVLKSYKKVKKFHEVSVSSLFEWLCLVCNGRFTRQSRHIQLFADSIEKTIQRQGTNVPRYTGHNRNDVNAFMLYKTPSMHEYELGRIKFLIACLEINLYENKHHRQGLSAAEMNYPDYTSFRRTHKFNYIMTEAKQRESTFSGYY